MDGRLSTHKTLARMLAFDVLETRKGGAESDYV